MKVFSVSFFWGGGTICFGEDDIVVEYENGGSKATSPKRQSIHLISTSTSVHGNKTSKRIKKDMGIIYTISI